ncbi:MAG: gamma-glutamyltransferase [Ilumatobacter fluminis]|uniref:gamma-glutamyltransferase family protein n=1 Tax=Ilumatobacter fluminis TaxID=467091 RepID=UPI0032EBC463
MNPLPQSSVRGSRHLVASADQLASRAGDAIFAAGGNAVDAAIATNAAIAVTGPHLCGMGGDLFALVHTGDDVVALNSSGRAGSGADADAIRADGHAVMPFHHDIRSVTVPGCVDGWVALHERFGSLPLADVLAPAIDLAERGFPASPLLVGSTARLDQAGREQLHELAAQATRTGAPVRRPGAARALRAIVEHGRDGFYGGEFGDGLLALGNGWYSPDDLASSSADWVDPLTASMFGVDVHTIGPNSQGYLTLAGGVAAEPLDLPDPDDERWAHLLIEAAKLAGYDRTQVLHEHADGDALVEAVRQRRHLLDTERASTYHAPASAGDTTYLCTAEADGLAVSLIQSNASGFGCWLAESNTGINLHNRGLGFSLEAGHPAELGPGRRPPHTLSPALATRGGELVSVFGTMGGDAQPQILLQVAARLFLHGQSPAEAINSARWALAGPETGFDTWSDLDHQRVEVEGHAPDGWEPGLVARGHRVSRLPEYDSGFGHAHAIVRDDNGLSGAADPRCRIGATIGR